MTSSQTSNGYTIEEFIDLVQNELNVSCALPKTLPDSTIRQIIETRALPWFYRNYQFAVQQMYYYIFKEAFETEEWTKYRYIQMPCEIQSIIFLYEVKGITLLRLGVNIPNLSINLGLSNQPYLSSYVATIGELGVYKALLSNMGDVLEHFNKFTLKFSYNQLNNRLNILTEVKNDIVVEAYANIPKENLFKDDLFYKYVVGYSKMQLANLVGRYDFNLPGGVKINASDIYNQGKEEVKEVEEEIKGQSNVSWFFMSKR